MPEPSVHPEQLFECHVLHRRDYANTSLLIELFSPELGRFPVIAKGAKRPRSSNTALLQPFRPLWVKVSGRGEVRTLGRVEQGEPGVPLSGSDLYCGFYLNELLVRLLGRGDANEELYAHYVQALFQLQAESDPFPVLRRFELRLLREIGYAMVLAQDADSGEPINPDSHYRYDPEHGPVTSLAGETDFTLSGRTLLGLARDEPLDAAGTREARQLMRRVLSHYLGDKPLKSRELFRHMRANRQS